jgi:ribosomal protein S18 acetylase RimI-like enzyme
MSEKKIEVDSRVLRIYQYLVEVDESFIPRLSSRVNIRCYAEKLSSFAQNIFCSAQGEDIGYIGFYINDKKTHYAFLSSLSVKSSHRGAGIADKLLEEVISRSREAGMSRLYLEVAPENKVAVKFYHKYSFERLTDTNYMVLHL